MKNKKIDETKSHPTETVAALKEVLSEDKLAVKYNNCPPFDWTRNEFGLLNHINYIFNEDGSVNWHAMIPPEHFVPNRQNFERRKQEIPKSIDGLDMKDLLLLLSGFKFISLLRGFSKVDQEIVVSREDYVAVKTTICLLPCYETNYQSVCFSELADAHINNTNGFGKYYLNAMASNRGFVRCWRNALRLPVTAFDEIGEVPKEESETEKKMAPAGPFVALQKKLDEKNISFEKLKITCINKGNYEGSDSWNSITDIKPSQIIQILDGFKEKESKEVK